MSSPSNSDARGSEQSRTVQDKMRALLTRLPLLSRTVQGERRAQDEQLSRPAAVPEGLCSGAFDL